MDDTQIIEEAYKEILKNIYKEFHVDEDVVKFEYRIDRLKKNKAKAISLLLNDQ